VSRDFEVGTNVSCEESTVSPIRGEHIFFCAHVTELLLLLLSWRWRRELCDAWHHVS